MMIAPCSLVVVDGGDDRFVGCCLFDQSLGLTNNNHNCLSVTR